MFHNDRAPQYFRFHPIFSLIPSHSQPRSHIHRHHTDVEPHLHYLAHIHPYRLPPTLIARLMPLSLFCALSLSFDSHLFPLASCSSPLSSSFRSSSTSFSLYSSALSPAPPFLSVMFYYISTCGCLLLAVTVAQNIHPQTLYICVRLPLVSHGGGAA